MSARTARTARTARRTRLFAATTVALAALALTACEGDTSDTGASAPAASSSSPSPAGAQSESPTGEKESGNGTEGNGSKETNGSAGSTGWGSSGSGSGSSGSGSSDKSDKGSAAGVSDDSDSDKPGKCSASDVKITAKKVSRPLNHLLLTATNTGSKTCMLPPYPAARFGEAQAVPPVAEATKPQSLTGVEPGKSGYAGVLLSSGDGSGENGYETNSLTIPFEDGSIATVALPAGGVYVDTALTVTYWQTGMDDALGY
ncbi:DUF4232 domain-containing protein [Streptomyces mutabilis]|uniref:DUF4232 domain-containing protein n=1 Tax=Streptomyces mutabilis TaxID=67332 RepID=UPI0022BA4863|nr:DUF4232 domain-containing protein [Streptomyces mutabilis]MCZ9355326.1 DUF4232 domain-containing protein [Streptomyces mutabilis]